MNPCSRTKPLTLVYLDDNPDEHLLFHRAVAKLHAPLRMVSVATSEAAKAYLRGHHTPGRRLHPGALILLDYQLLAETSLGIVRWIRARARFNRLPVIIYTSCDVMDIISRCYTAGANAFLCKPVRFQRIEQIVSALIRCSRAHPFDLTPLACLPEFRGTPDCELITAT